VREASDDELRALAGVSPIPAPPTEEVHPAPAAPPARSRAESRRLFEALVMTAADAMDVAPKRVRVAIDAVIRQMQQEGMSVEEAAGAIEAKKG
jgi:hypothetical protein